MPTLEGLPRIRQLDEAAINRIAAGEIVERPASVVKELIENALDAGATRIELAVRDGGKSMIRVTDDGHGIPEEDLPLAMARHATSKIDGSDLFNIQTFGFRGEALPSLAAVGRLTITSRARGAPSAFSIVADGGGVSPARPAALARGTIVELRDIFYATPARLKFLRTERSEMQAISDVIKRLAMAEPYVGFTISDYIGDAAPRTSLRADPEVGDIFVALKGRLQKILGSDFVENALQVDAERGGITLTGFAALPTYSRGAATAQYLFVNGRPVRDKLLVGALRGAYSDFMSRNRHPAVVLFLECDPQKVDVNVHPAKAEVRFRDPSLVRGLIISALKHALANAGHRASTTVATATLGAFCPEPKGASIYQMGRPSQKALKRPYEAQAPWFDETTPVSARVEDVATVEDTPLNAPLGAARAHVHENYIIAQTTDGIIIVDQHAAHERLVYETLKCQIAEKGVATQALLIPEIVEMSEDDAALVLEHAESLARFGLAIESFGQGAVVVRETPAILGVVNAKGLLLDILDEITDLGDSQTLSDRIDAVLSRVACHGSIRSGRRMGGDEMNALLREMEATPHSGQCNHGRPTYVELKLADIERLFGRT